MLRAPRAGAQGPGARLCGDPATSRGVLALGHTALAGPLLCPQVKSPITRPLPPPGPPQGRASTGVSVLTRRAMSETTSMPCVQIGLHRLWNPAQPDQPVPSAPAACGAPFPPKLHPQAWVGRSFTNTSGLGPPEYGPGSTMHLLPHAGHRLSQAGLCYEPPQALTTAGGRGDQYSRGSALQRAA